MNSVLQHLLLLLTFFLPGLLAYAGDTPFCNFQTEGYYADRFEIYDDGTAKDKYTNLIWRRCSLGEEWNTDLQRCTGSATGANWRNILQQIEAFNLEQYNIGNAYDWRLPNIKEMTSLATLECFLYAIDTNVFPVPRSAYWTSTPFNVVAPEPVYDADDVLIGFQDQNMIWVVNVLTGRENWAKWTQTNYYALLVRGESRAE